MRKAILGRKLGMTQVWGEDDELVPVTVIEAGPCVVSQVKTLDSDGYDAVQLAFGEVRADKLTKPVAGHFAKAGVEPRRHVAEFRTDVSADFSVGDEVDVGIFEPGDLVDVSGTSKGKGFAGVVKRHRFRGGPGGHGSHFHRQPGSIGQAATPSRVFKGKRMAGRMGGGSVTVRNLEVVRVEPEQHVLLVKGAVPGGKGSVLRIRGALGSDA